jgi:hypothetical protein
VVYENQILGSTNILNILCTILATFQLNYWRKSISLIVYYYTVKDICDFLEMQYKSFTQNSSVKISPLDFVKRWASFDQAKRN